MCAGGRSGGTAHFFAIGDWGGIGKRAHTFDNTGDPQKKRKRKYVEPIDKTAQHMVADVMKQIAVQSRPQFIVNVGDNFYPGGIEANCGQADTCTLIDTKQWHYIFEQMYRSAELDKTPWFSCLGNHDYGGWQFSKGWDQQIAYTWYSDKWIMPGQYWMRRVQYCDFSADFFFVDTQTFDAVEPTEHPGTNICAEIHNHRDCSAIHGPQDADQCVPWFRNLWKRQLEWLEKELEASDADWQIIVTHFPPQWGLREWRELAVTYGIDLFITGHRHQQEMHLNDKMLGGTTWVVTGGGGGVTSESDPNDDSPFTQQYGFIDLTISKRQLQMDMWSWKNTMHGSYTIEPRQRVPASCAAQGCDSQYINGKPCYCHKTCSSYGNCCEDYEAVCVEARSKCSSVGCSSFIAGAPCQCNDQCEKFGNCCGDYFTICAGDGGDFVPAPGPAPPPPGPRPAFRPPPPSPASKPTEPGGALTDSDPQCHAWAKDGECTWNRNWMMRNCRKTCVSKGRRLRGTVVEQLSRQPLRIDAAIDRLHGAMLRGEVMALEDAILDATYALASARQSEVDEAGAAANAFLEVRAGRDEVDELHHLLGPAETTLALLMEELESKTKVPSPVAPVFKLVDAEIPIAIGGAANISGRRLEQGSCLADRRRRFKPSCAMLGCVEYNSRFPCQCNKGCAKYNACCSDYQELCGPKPLCSVLGCNKYDADSPCQCLSSCRKYGNCCSDYNEICVGEGFGGGAGHTAPEAFASTTRSPVPAPAIDLLDKNRYCSDWAKRGECSANSRWMLKNCAKSCATVIDVVGVQLQGASDLPQLPDVEYMSQDVFSMSSDLSAEPCLEKCDGSGWCEGFCGVDKACCKKHAPDNAEECRYAVGYVTSDYECVTVGDSRTRIGNSFFDAGIGGSDVRRSDATQELASYGASTPARAWLDDVGWTLKLIVLGAAFGITFMVCATEKRRPRKKRRRRLEEEEELADGAQSSEAAE